MGEAREAAGVRIEAAGVRIALATCRELPQLDEDEAPLRAALEARGATVDVGAWDDPAWDVTGARACVIRSTWNYIHRPEAFLEWADECATLTRLWNPSSVIRWNSHKGYLLELEARGVPIVPTRLVKTGTRPALRDLVGPWAEFVVKPAISAGSFGTIRADRASLDAAEAHLHHLALGHDLLVQEYMPDVEGRGERALVFIDGALSHAVRKGARFAGDAEAISSEALPVADDERGLAERTLAAAPGPLLYARVDMVRDADGAPRLMELELIEPSLFLDRAPGAADKLAAAILARR